MVPLTEVPLSDTAPSPARNRRDEPFKDWIAVLIAAVAVLAAVAAWQQADAGGRSATAYRQARRFHTAALGQKDSGQAAIGYSLYSAQAWYELGALARAAEERGDLTAAQRYQAVRERIAGLSALLQSPYDLDLARFEADTYLVQATELAERAADATAQGDAWNARADTYISFVFAQDGEYRVELYVEGHLVQWGEFSIEKPPIPQVGGHGQESVNGSTPAGPTRRQPLAAGSRAQEDGTASCPGGHFETD